MLGFPPGRMLWESVNVKNRKQTSKQIKLIRGVDHDFALSPFSLKHKIVTQIAEAHQEPRCTGLKHWILLESVLLGGR